MDNTPTSFDVAVIGGGPTGVAAAIALAQTGASTALIARCLPYADNRTTALLGATIDFLERLEVWPNCRNQAAPLQTMRLVDDTGRLIRAPEVTFSSAEIGVDQFGYNIQNEVLMVALEQRAARLPNLTRFDDEAAAIEPEKSMTAISTAGGAALSARLAVGADGRQSPSRKAAGIAVSRRDLGQAALTLDINHSRAHRNISTEFHTSSGPCVFVPLPGERCSVVWVSKPDQAARLLALSDDELSENPEAQSHSILGRVRIEPGRHLFPLAIETSAPFARHRVALVGKPDLCRRSARRALTWVYAMPPILQISQTDARANGRGSRCAACPSSLPTRRVARMSQAGSFAIDLANARCYDFLPVQWACGKSTSDRRRRTAAPARDARGAGAIVAFQAPPR